jgi:hypothetical protein
MNKFKTRKFLAAIYITLIVTILFSTHLYAGQNPSDVHRFRPNGVLYANFLNKLGLFRGSDHGYELDRTLNRDEAAVMIVRLMGAEDEVLSGIYNTPFDDLDDWARPYIVYGKNIRLETQYN